jgi:predicted ATPase
MRCWAAEVYWLKGELLWRQAIPDEAVSLAGLWQRQGKRAAAQQMLAEVYGWFTEGFDTADLQEAKALLDEMGG